MKFLDKIKKQTELKELRSQLETLTSQQTAFVTRSSELEKAINEANTDEDIKTVRESVEALETEMLEADCETKLNDLNEKIRTIEEELDKPDEVPAPAINTNEEVRNMALISKAQTRQMLESGEYYRDKTVVDFYDRIKNLRSVGGEGLTIPQNVLNRIVDIMGDFTTLYPLVDKITVNGTARILLDTDTEAATWMEMKGAIPTGNVGTITSLDFDGFKVGKVVLVDNAIMQDSIINLDDYVTKKIARAIAKAVDKAIVKGAGAASKEPTGIIPSLNSSNKVTIPTGPMALINTVKQIGLIDTGEDATGTIIAVMNRKTYYNIFFEYSVQVNSNGNVVGKLPNLTAPDLIGVRVVFNNNLDENTVLFGDFSKYTLVERESIVVENSDQYKFAEDQTSFRGKGRYDGKPTNPDAFVLVTITEGE